MLQQIAAEVLQRSSRPLDINHPHPLEQHWENCSLQILCISQPLDGFPLCGASGDLTALGSEGSAVGLLNSRFKPVDFLISEGLSLLDTFDEVVEFEDSSMRLHFNHIHVLNLLPLKRMPRHQVTHVNTTIRIIVEKDVMSKVISLVNQHRFASGRRTPTGVPRLIVFLDQHH